VRSADELRGEVEAYLDELALTPELEGLAEAMRYALDGGGKRIRPVLCLAVGDALGCEAERLLPAAAAVELVHTFSLVHDDLPALDDDDVRRGRPSTHVRFGEGIAVIAGDALLAEAFRLALSYPATAVARELVQATLGMIGGQYLDLTGQRDDELALTRLKTGRLFDAAVGCALEIAGVPERERAPWRSFSAELGLVFQLVDDVLDEDGYAAAHGLDAARRLADEAAERALARLDEVDADTSVLSGLVTTLAARTS
jgi:geranylgeranyl diphosphate synthase, type II